MLELRQHYPLAGLLTVAQLARSTFFYQQKAMKRLDSHVQDKVRIQQLFEQHKGCYGYRRITATLRKEGRGINHKTVQKLMGNLGLKCRIRPKKYHAYRGEAGCTAPNLLKRQFSAQQPNQKWVTDVSVPQQAA